MEIRIDGTNGFTASGSAAIFSVLGITCGAEQEHTAVPVISPLATWPERFPGRLDKLRHFKGHRILLQPPTLRRDEYSHNRFQVNQAQCRRSPACRFGISHGITHGGTERVFIGNHVITDAALTGSYYQGYDVAASAANAMAGAVLRPAVTRMMLGEFIMTQLLATIKRYCHLQITTGLSRSTPFRRQMVVCSVVRSPFRHKNCLG
ncbi:hypothetical protein ACLB1E_18385 [Escherichia coli]